MVQEKRVESYTDKYSIVLYSFSRDMAAREKVKFIREFFGYGMMKNAKNYQYKGILQKLDGIKVSRSSFMIPPQNMPVVEAYLKMHKVDYVIKA